MKISIPKEVLQDSLSVPIGQYEVQVTGESPYEKDGKIEGLFIKCRVLKGEYEGTILTKFISTKETALWVLLDFATACGYDISTINDKNPIDTTKFIGKKLLATVSSTERKNSIDTVVGI